MESDVISEIIDNIRFFISIHDEANLKTICFGTHPVEIADLIAHLSEDEAIYIFGLLPLEMASEVLLNLDDYNRELITDELKFERLAELVSEMDSDDAADVVSDLSEDKAQKVLQEIDKEDSEDVQELLRHEEDTAGGIMALELICVNQNSTVDEAIHQIRQHSEEVEDVYNIYVVDNDEKLLGILSIKQLILSNGTTPIAEIMETDVIKVTEEMDQEAVANLVKKYDLVSVPVVDKDGRLTGRITYDDIMDVVDEEASEDIHRLAGITDDVEIHDTSAFRISRVRIPWLLFAFAGEIVSASIMSHFEASLEKILIAAFFIPIIMAMGGNAGIQSSTIMVRGLALGEIGLLHARKQIAKEFRVSLINGIICASLIFAIISIWFSEMPNNIEFGAVIGLAMFIIIINATIVGAIIPLFLKKIDVDPAIATGPFITTTNDVLGLSIYLGLTTYFLIHHQIRF